MAFNNIELIVKYSTDAFDEVYKAESRSALLDGDKKLMQFTGAKTVKIMKFAFTGLSDYKRNNLNSKANLQVGNATLAPVGTAFDASHPIHDQSAGFGYQAAAMGGEWEEFTIACDRAAQYRVELFDNEETAQMAVGMGTTEINRVVIVPEIDAYCFAKLCGYTNALLGNLVTSSYGSTPIAALNNALLYFDNKEVPAEDQIIFCAPSFMKSIRETSEVVKPLLQSDFGKNKNVKFTIEEYEGRPIVVVPPSRFQSAIELYQGGFRSAGRTMDFMVVSKKAVYHIVKYNKIKVFGPDVVQDYDGYKINARIYHDVFVPDNKRYGIYCHCYASNVADGLTLNIAGIFDAGDTKLAVTGIELFPAGTMISGTYYILGASASDAGFVAVGDDVPGSPNVLTLNSAISYSTNTHIQVYVADIYGKVLATTVKTIADLTAGNL